jgi:hypothetical protein
MLHSLLQVVAVFDADQVARPNFFTRTLPWLQDGRESVVLTPQYFHNFDVQTDIFSHRQAAYWNMILPGQVSRSDLHARDMLASVPHTMIRLRSAQVAYFDCLRHASDVGPEPVLMINAGCAWRHRVHRVKLPDPRSAPGGSRLLPHLHNGAPAPTAGMASRPCLQPLC